MNINQVAYQVYGLSKTNVTVLQRDESITEYTTDTIPRVLSVFIKDLSQQMFALRHEARGSMFYYNFEEYGLSYFLIRLAQSEWVIGPYLEKKDNDQAFRTLKLKLQTSSLVNEQINDYLINLPVMEPSYLRFIKLFITEYLNYEQHEEIIKLEHTKPSTSPLNISLIREEDYTYVTRNYENEAVIMRLVKDGNMDDLLKLFKNIPATYLPDRVPHNELRNIKNRLIILNTLATRKAIEGGIDIYLAHQLSTNHGILIERATSNYEIEKLSLVILKNFTIAVRDYQNAKYSKLVRDLILYLRSNITSPLSLEKAAKSLYVTKEHLARIVKKETGKTIYTLMTAFKMSEAISLLDQKQLSITQIAYHLGYSSPSHFSATFTKENGISPRDYQQKKLI